MANDLSLENAKQLWFIYKHNSGEINIWPLLCEKALGLNKN